MKKALRIARTVIAIGAALSLTAVVAADLAVERIGHGRLCDRPEEVPAGRAALVLGTSQLLRDGSPNPYFDNRIRAAVLLWRTGRITAIVVSGDNGRTTYNEPEAMRDALVTQGVPAEAIRLDHAGFRTLDSVVRMHEIFGQRAFVVVSQEFHNLRAAVWRRRGDQRRRRADGRDDPRVAARTAGPGQALPRPGFRQGAEVPGGADRTETIRT